MTEEEKKHQSYSITYKQMKFRVAEPEVGSITIEFEDPNTLVKYATRKHLDQVSYKTVVSALMQSEPKILSIQMNPLADLMYEMRVKVKLEYLNEIYERFVFEGIRLEEERVKHIKATLKWQQGLKKAKQSIVEASHQVVVSGKIDNRDSQHQQIYLDVPFDTTLFSIFISFSKLKDNVVKTQFCYYDSRTKADIPENMLPDELYVNEPSEFSVIGHRSSFDKVVFRVGGDFEEMEYQIKCVNVKNASHKNHKQLYIKWLKLIFFGLSLYGLYSLIKGIFFSSSQQSPPEL